MNYKQIYYPESGIAGFSNVDGTIAFYTKVNALVSPSSTVVDIGCGRGAYAEDPIPFRRGLRIFRGRCRKVIGLDVDPRARENPFLDEFCIIEGERWAVESASADVCIVDNVLEHVEDPGGFFSECRRVLKPGGFVCIRTPNVLSYFGLISRLVPDQKRLAVLEKAKDRVKEQDVFPVFYNCNSIPKIKSTLQKHEFVPYVYGYDAEPSYLSFSRLFYYLGVLHQRFAPDLIKVGIHAFGRKQPGYFEASSSS